MKSSKKMWIIGAALLAFTSLQVSAQQGKRAQVDPVERAQKTTEKMATELNLTDAQKSRILELNLEQAKMKQFQAEMINK